MANRYPLIFDTVDNKLKEIPSNDNLNLTGSGIVGVTSITCTGPIVGKSRFTVYNNNVVPSDVILTSSDMNSVVLLNTSAARTVTLPIGSSVQIGDWIRIVDAGTGATNTGNAYTNNITITPNVADSIQGGTAGSSFVMNVDRQSTTLMWCGSVYDWRLVSMDKYIGPASLPEPVPDEYKNQLLAALPLNSTFGFTDQSVLIRGSGSSANVVNYYDAGAETTIQTNKFKFYGSSARKQLSSPAPTTFFESHIDINTGSGSQFGTGDFCIEAWIRTADFSFNGLPAHGFIFPRWRNNTADTYGYVPFIRITGSNWAGVGVSRSILFSSPNDVPICQTGSVLNTNTWHHIAITRSGSTNRVFVDGVLQASASNSENWVGYEYWFFDTIRILDAEFNIQDIRIYKGIPKYTSNFIPLQIFK